MISIRRFSKNAKQKSPTLKSSIEVLERIADDGRISDADLRLLVEKIEIAEKDDKIDVTVILNGKFRQHIDFYNEGELDETYMQTWWQAM